MPKLNQRAIADDSSGIHHECMPRQLERRDALLGLRHVEHGAEPHRQIELGGGEAPSDEQFQRRCNEKFGLGLEFIEAFGEDNLTEAMRGEDRKSVV